MSANVGGPLAPRLAVFQYAHGPSASASLSSMVGRCRGRVAVFVAVVACSGHASEGSSSIVGEWSQMPPEPGATLDLFWFNADGTCGHAETSAGETACVTGCTYSISGSNVSVTYTQDDRTYTDVYGFSVSGDSLTLLYRGSSSLDFTRVNSSSTNSAPVACGLAPDGGLPIPADAFVQATVGPGTQNPASCLLTGSPQTWVSLGTATQAKPTTVQSGGDVFVACSVVPSGGGFNIDLDAHLLGSAGAELSVFSAPGKGAVTPSGATGLAASFVSQAYGTFSATDCALSFEYQGSPVPVSPPVAAGRIWGHLSCPTASMGSSICDAEADFLFEQCAR